MLLFGFGFAPMLHAGLYNTTEPDEGKLGPDFAAFRTSLLSLRAISFEKVPFEDALRKRYILAADLASRGSEASLSVEQKLDLGAVFIRRKKFNDALKILVPLAAEERSNFLIASNLATLYQVMAEERKALATLEGALDSWPTKWSDLKDTQRDFVSSIGWNEGVFDWYRQVETYQLKLLRLRVRATQNKATDNVDPLFSNDKGPVQFVGESGAFEPGKIATAQKAKLPANAVDIVKQLLLWMPDDMRLYWLLGELLNANGDEAGAKAIFNELVEGSQMRSAQLLEHRKALRDVPAPVDDGKLKILEEKINQSEKDQAVDVRLDWKMWWIGFGTGAAVALFTLFQVREARRRMQRRRM